METNAEPGELSCWLLHPPSPRVISQKEKQVSSVWWNTFTETKPVAQCGENDIWKRCLSLKLYPPPFRLLSSQVFLPDEGDWWKTEAHMLLTTVWQQNTAWIQHFFIKWNLLRVCLKCHLTAHQYLYQRAQTLLIFLSSLIILAEM